MIAALGPAVAPFERDEFNKKLKPGETHRFDEHVYDATEGGKPDQIIEVTTDSIRLNPKHGCYLWIIDEGGLRLLLEATPNPHTERQCVCHTNITGGANALQGGELWFGVDDRVHINFKSGRYGAKTMIQSEAVLTYFRFVGYEIALWKEL